MACGGKRGVVEKGVWCQVGWVETSRSVLHTIAIFHKGFEARRQHSNQSRSWESVAGEI